MNRRNAVATYKLRFLLFAGEEHEAEHVDPAGPAEEL